MDVLYVAALLALWLTGFALVRGCARLELAQRPL